MKTETQVPQFDLFGEATATAELPPKTEKTPKKPKVQPNTPKKLVVDPTLAEKACPRVSPNPTNEPGSPVKKSFTAHANLIYQAMTRQAGTLGKAILEGVMNSIDANATKVEITLTQTDFQIVDDGKGMQAEQEIDDYFAVLGTPHETDPDGKIKDAKYGEYRMGRGQIFAQGISRWRTGPFELLVDLKAWGLDFQQNPNPEPTKGCSIHTQLYAPLSISDFQNVQSETKRFCKYVEIPVFLNGKQINTPPRDRKWTAEDEVAYYQIEKTDTRQTGVDLYQQGVYVERIPSWQDGLNGIVVTKNRMTLNFARNQAMRDCPVYKAIAKKLRSFGERNVKKKNNKTLSLPERVSEILRQEGRFHGDILSTRLFADVQGKMWSMNMLLNAGKTFHATPSGAVALSFAEAGNRMADKIMESKQGIVLDREILTSLEVAGMEINEENFIETFGRWRSEQRIQYFPLAKLTEGISKSHHLVAKNKLTPKETLLLGVLQKTCWDLSYLRGSHRSYRRELRVGLSETADGWTDGKTYISINREFLTENLQATPRNIGNLILLLIHEYCHDEEDTDTHVHSPEFYKAYHDLSLHQPKLQMQAFQNVIKELEAKGKTLPPQIEKTVLQEKLVGADEELEVAYQNTDQLQNEKNGETPTLQTQTEV